MLFNQYGLNEIWDAEYSKVGVKHISAGAWDPCHFATKDPIRSLADLKGKRVFTFPTAGPLPDASSASCRSPCPGKTSRSRCRPASWTASPGRALPRTTPSGWADVTNYFLTNNISGAWAGSFFANMDRWNELPEDSARPCSADLLMDQSHYYRQWWYWGGEAKLARPRARRWS